MRKNHALLNLLSYMSIQTTHLHNSEIVLCKLRENITFPPMLLIKKCMQYKATAGNCVLDHNTVNPRKLHIIFKNIANCTDWEQCATGTLRILRIWFVCVRLPVSISLLFSFTPAFFYFLVTKEIEVINANLWYHMYNWLTNFSNWVVGALAEILDICA